MRTIKYDTWNISKTYHCMEVPGWSQFKDPSCSKKKKKSIKHEHFGSITDGTTLSRRASL